MNKPKYTGFMSHSHSSGTEAHQQKIDEILSIYIQSEMIGRKNNNLNLKISSVSTTGAGGHHFPTNKTSRPVAGRLKSVPLPHSQSLSQVTSKTSKPVAPPFSKSHSHPVPPSTAPAQFHISDRSARYSSDGNIPSSRRSSTIILSPKKTFVNNSHRGTIFPIRGKRINDGHNHNNGHGNGKNSNTGLKEKDAKVTFSSDKMSEFQADESNFQFQHPDSMMNHGHGHGNVGSGSSVSENDDESNNDIRSSIHSPVSSVQDTANVNMTPPRPLTSPISRRESPRQSPMYSPTFNQSVSRSSPCPCSPKHGDCSPSPSVNGQPKESYARILATLKRIEDEERYGYNAVGRGDYEQPLTTVLMSSEDKEKSCESGYYHPNLPPGDQFIPSRPSTPLQGQNHFNFNNTSQNSNVHNGNGGHVNGNGNGNIGHPCQSPTPSQSQSPSPRKLNNRFTAVSSAIIVSTAPVPASIHSSRDSPSPKLPSASCSSTPRLPPLPTTMENNHNANTNGSVCYQSQSKNQNHGHGHGHGHFHSHNTAISVANSNSGHSGGSASDANRHTVVEENVLYEIHSARSFGLGDEPIRLSSCDQIRFRPASIPSNSPRWGDTSDEKAKNIYSFLDEVEKMDRETLFNLKHEKSIRSADASGGNAGDTYRSNFSTRAEFPNHTMDSLIRKGSVELAREVILLERKIEESQHNIQVLEETLINQRELNIRHIKNSERDLKKRLKLQQEEFELALTRHQAFVDQLIAEKRALQDKCEKILRDLKETEMKHQDQTKSLQSKHLEELKRIRRVQESSEKNRRMKWMGNKTQEIRETTIKGLEPELQRVIQRHQQEMTEMRAWHANELQEMEERCSRKLLKQAQEIREQMIQEQEEGLRRDRELMNRRHESEIEQLTQELETQKRRHLQEIHEERERFEVEQQKVKDLIQESVKKVEIKAEVELETLKEHYEAKLLAQERRHEAEIKTLSDVQDAERESYIANYNKKLEQAISEKELILSQTNKVEKEAEIEERERKLRQDFDKQWKEQEDLYESRLKRLQEKFQAEIKDFEDAERELKTKFTQVKAELITKEEEIFTLKTTVNLKEKQNTELADGNMKMLEERASLTGVIRREFITQIENLEKECMAVRSSVVELKAKHKMDQEQHLVELDKVRNEKDFELDKVGQRVVQAMSRKEETIVELQKQLEKASFRVSHLEELLEQQRKEFVKSMTVTTGNSSSKNKHK